jgi:hypothetical protein
MTNKIKILTIHKMNTPDKHLNLNIYLSSQKTKCDRKRTLVANLRLNEQYLLEGRDTLHSLKGPI